MSKQPRLFRPNKNASVLARIKKLIGELRRRFPTELDCLLEICRAIVHSGYVRCDECNSNEFDRHENETVMTCRRCGTERRCTRGTPFYKTKRPRAWLLLLTLFENRIILSGEEFARFAKIAGSTARNMMHQVASGLAARMSRDRSTRSVRSVVLSPVIARRTRMTPADEHPVREEDAFEQSPAEHASAQSETFAEPEENPSSEEFKHSEEATTNTHEATADTNDASTQPGNISGLSKEAAMVYAAIGVEPVNFDGILLATSLSFGALCAAILELEAAGLIQPMPGNLVRRTPRNIQDELFAELTEADIEAALECLEFIRAWFGGIGRKYAQHYAALYWWLKQGYSQDIMGICFDGTVKTYADLLAYVSPKFIYLAA